MDKKDKLFVKHLRTEEGRLLKQLEAIRKVISQYEGTSFDKSPDYIIKDTTYPYQSANRRKVEWVFRKAKAELTIKDIHEMAMEYAGDDLPEYVIRNAVKSMLSARRLIEVGDIKSYPKIYKLVKLKITL